MLTNKCWQRNASKEIRYKGVLLSIVIDARIRNCVQGKIVPTGTKGRYFFRSTARLYSVTGMIGIQLKGSCVHSRYSPRNYFQDL